MPPPTPDGRTGSVPAGCVCPGTTPPPGPSPRPFDIVRDGENTFSWFHSAIAEHLHEQWVNAPDGCHCENTKVRPYCLAGAGLGLQLHDLLRGTDLHSAFDTCGTTCA